LPRKVSEIFTGATLVVAANNALIKGKRQNLCNLQMLKIGVRRIQQNIKIACRNCRRNPKHAILSMSNKSITNNLG
jgi:hypothetical protein